MQARTLRVSLLGEARAGFKPQNAVAAVVVDYASRWCYFDPQLWLFCGLPDAIMVRLQAFALMCVLGMQFAVFIKSVYQRLPLVALLYSPRYAETLR